MLSWQAATCLLSPIVLEKGRCEKRKRKTRFTHWSKKKYISLLFTILILIFSNNFILSLVSFFFLIKLYCWFGGKSRNKNKNNTVLK
jgi:hypothetical protein